MSQLTDIAADAEVAVPRLGRPNAAAAERLNARILEAATEEFLAWGVADSSIERIATRCGTTRRSIVARYPTKGDLLIAVVDKELDRQRIALDISDLAIEDPIDRLREGLWRLMQNAVNPRSLALHRVCAPEMHKSPKLATAITAVADELIRQISGLYLNAQRAGKFNRHSAGAIAYYTFSIVVQNTVTRAMLGDDSFIDPLGLELHFSDAWSFIAAMA